MKRITNDRFKITLEAERSVTPSCFYTGFRCLFMGRPHLTQLELTGDGELERRSKGKPKNCEEKEATVRSCWSSA
jgi:hypothetical protein